jgi:adenylyl-sulfate kinase
MLTVDFNAVPLAGTIWFTGLPAAGKTTLAQAALRRLQAAGVAGTLLDGDALRRTVSADLGYDRASREEQARRAARRALEVVTDGGVALVALVSPYAAARDAARTLHERAGAAFVEVWVSTPALVCRARDPRGLWARAARGEIQGLTGWDDPYEAPVAAEVTVATHEAPDAAAARAVAALAAVGRRAAA